MTKRILVAEDDPTTSLLVKRALSSQGYEVECVENGEQVLGALAGDVQPDLLILDLLMPVMDGWTVLRKLQEQDRLQKLPVLVLSGAPKDGLRSTKEFGVLFLVKPFDLPVLLAMIEYLTGVLAQRARLEGIILATRTIQHYVRNHLSLTMGYCELLARDAGLTERQRTHATQALAGVRSACDRLDTLEQLTNLETELTLGSELIRFPENELP